MSQREQARKCAPPQTHLGEEDGGKKINLKYLFYTLGELLQNTRDNINSLSQEASYSTMWPCKLYSVNEKEKNNLEPEY